MKSDFRTNKSLAADIERIESSLIKNIRDLSNLMTNIKEKSSVILNSESVKSLRTKGIELKDTLYSYSTSIRDVIDSLENDLISIEGIDVFEIKTSPDEIIDKLRKLKENTRHFDKNVENQIKLLIKSKGNGQFADEIDSGERAISKTIKSSNNIANDLISSLDNILMEVGNLKEHSKELLKSKIL
jgi:uncharacterized protein YdcH (DUF465 family)